MSNAIYLIQFEWILSCFCTHLCKCKYSIALLKYLFQCITYTVWESLEHSNDKVLYARRCSISRSTKWLQVHLTIVMEIFSLKFDRLHLTFLGHKPQKDLTKQLFWGLQGQRAFFALLYCLYTCISSFIDCISIVWGHKINFTRYFDWAKYK